ncbi:MAG: hypothetical protein HC913_16960 [Microscillaceae bacterium]|nr:hypothetical protein [Microscillaceae bacterium]
MYGFAPGTFLAEDFNQKESVLMFGSWDAEINLMGYLDGLPDFAPVFANRHRAKILTQEYNFIGLSALLENKKATGRPKDQLDVENLERIHQLPSQNS